MARNHRLEIYTDGACWPNPGPGGWAAVFRSTHGAMYDWCLTGHAPRTTNNRMEIGAVLAALRSLSQPYEVVVCSDARYVVNAMTDWVNSWQRRGWRKSSGEPVKNADLWVGLLSEARRHDVVWRWVKGHAHNQHNNRADELALRAMNQELPGDATAWLVPEVLQS